jgi:hypothetical protein
LLDLARNLPHTEKFGPSSNRLTGLAKSLETIFSARATSEAETLDLIEDILSSTASGSQQGGRKASCKRQ